MLPFQRTVEPLRKLAPFTVRVNASPPANALPGDRLLRVGAGLLTGKVCAAEVPPPGAGVTTVTEAVPVAARSAAGIAAVSCVALTKVVVRAAPFHWTVAPFTKPLPVSVSVKPAPPTIALDGDSVASVGAGLLIVKVCAAEVPPPGAGVTTVTDAVPVAATSAAGIAAVSLMALTNVVVRAAPFHCTVLPATKLLPLAVSVKAALPAVAVAGDTDVSTGAGLVPTRPVPVTPREILPPLAVNVTLVAVRRPVTGVNRTVTVAVAPTPTRLNEPPETTLNGAATVAVPDTVPPPVFWTVNVWSRTLPMFTVPKSTVPIGLTLKSILAAALADVEHALSLPPVSTAVTATKYRVPGVRPVSVAATV